MVQLLRSLNFAYLVTVVAIVFYEIFPVPTSQVKVLRRKLDSVERSYDVLLDEVRAMRVRVEGRDTTPGSLTPSASSGDSGKTHDEKVQELVRDIERLKWRLIEKDKDAAEKVLSSKRGSGGLQKSRSLEDDTGSSAGGSASGYLEQHHQFDLKMQLDTVRQEAQVTTMTRTCVHHRHGLASCLMCA
jgi:hypothetical protein